MKKYLTTVIKILKYVGITLLVGYLFMIVKVVYTQRNDDIPPTERIANAVIGSLYAYVITVVSYIITLGEDITGNKNKDRNNNTYGYNIG